MPVYGLVVTVRALPQALAAPAVLTVWRRLEGRAVDGSEGLSHFRVADLQLDGGRPRAARGMERRGGHMETREGGVSHVERGGLLREA